MENSIEIVEIFLATAKTGLVIVPINFRLVGREVEYIVDNSMPRPFSSMMNSPRWSTVSKAA